MPNFDAKAAALSAASRQAVHHLAEVAMHPPPLPVIPYPEPARQIALDYTGPRWTPEWDVRALIHLACHTSGHYLEIGVNEGRTLREVALAHPLRHCYGVDWSQARLCPEQAGEVPAAARIGWHSRELSNVSLWDLPSREVWPRLPVADAGTAPRPGAPSRRATAPVTTIFIDGDHTGGGVREDTRAAAAYLAGQAGGLLVWHDCYEGSPAWCGVQAYLRSRNARRAILQEPPVPDVALARTQPGRVFQLAETWLALAWIEPGAASVD